MWCLVKEVMPWQWIGHVGELKPGIWMSGDKNCVGKIFRNHCKNYGMVEQLIRSDATVGIGQKLQTWRGFTIRNSTKLDKPKSLSGVKTACLVLSVNNVNSEEFCNECVHWMNENQLTNQQASLFCTGSLARSHISRDLDLRFDWTGRPRFKFWKRRLRCPDLSSGVINFCLIRVTHGNDKVKFKIRYVMCVIICSRHLNAYIAKKLCFFAKHLWSWCWETTAPKSKHQHRCDAIHTYFGDWLCPICTFCVVFISIQMLIRIWRPLFLDCIISLSGYRITVCTNYNANSISWLHWFTVNSLSFLIARSIDHAGESGIDSILFFNCRILIFLVSKAMLTLLG